MRSPAATPPADLVMVVVLDGLRPDAIDSFSLPQLSRLREIGAYSSVATTVSPSATWAAMASLLTGVSPDRHGIVHDVRRLSMRDRGLDPLPRVLERAGFPTIGVLGDVPRLYRPISSAIGRRLGIADIHHAGHTAPEIAIAAGSLIAQRQRGLVIIHLPDADRAGHTYGWMSPQYEQGAHRLDAAAGMIAMMANPRHQRRTRIIMLADHGGGGVVPNEHGSDHPLDRTIPLLMLGSGVPAGRIAGAPRLLDVPVSVCDALGVSVPESYEGRTLELETVDDVIAA